MRQKSRIGSLVNAGLVFPLLFSLHAESAPFQPSCPSPSFPTPAPSQALLIDQTCPVGGQPNKPPAETGQNSAKNNFCATGAPTPITVNDMQALQKQVENNKNINFGDPKSTNPGPTKDRAPLKQMGEGTVRVLEGYVLIARQEGKELVNCDTTPPDLPASHDIHISIVGNVSQVHGNECQSVVVEMSPHHRPDSWDEQNVQKVALAHKRVRVTGQLFFDSSHSPCVNGTVQAGDPRRMSLWEIHPIYKFEVCPKDTCTPAEWTPLDQWIKQHP